MTEKRTKEDQSPETLTPEALTEDQLDAAAGGYEMKNIFVTSYQTNGSAADSAEAKPTEEVAFYYNKIAFN